MAPMDFGHDGRSKLCSLDKYIEPKTDSQFNSGDPITITLRGAMIRENEDGMRPPLIGKNDLFIMTTFQFAQDPPIQKLHMMEKDVDLGWHGDFFNRIVLAMRDFKDINEALTLQVQIYDADEWNLNFLDGLNGVAQSAAVAFPALAPYAAGAPLIKSAASLAEKTDRHDKIIEERIVLEAVAEESGHKLLQQGYYVCFRKPVDIDTAGFLDNQMRVLKPNGTEFEDCSYAVLEINKDFRLPRDVEIDQKAAKLAAELGRKEHGDKAPLDFLRDTLSAYSKFRDLQRANELREKKKLAETDKTKALSSSEDKLLTELECREDLKPYLK